MWHQFILKAKDSKNPSPIYVYENFGFTKESVLMEIEEAGIFKDYERYTYHRCSYWKHLLGAIIPFYTFKL